MNHPYEQEIRYKLLKLLSTNATVSQRDMAKRTGISLGKTNYVLTELANKGIIKIKRFKSAPSKIPYTYTLTPHGLEEKAKITLMDMNKLRDGAFYPACFSFDVRRWTLDVGVFAYLDVRLLSVHLLTALLSNPRSA